MRAIADLWILNMTSTVIATRGERLILLRAHYSGRDQGPEAFHTEVLGIVEIDADERIVADEMLQVVALVVVELLVDVGRNRHRCAVLRLWDDAGAQG